MASSDPNSSRARHPFESIPLQTTTTDGGSSAAAAAAAGDDASPSSTLIGSYSPASPHITHRRGFRGGYTSLSSAVDEPTEHHERLSLDRDDNEEERAGSFASQGGRRTGDGTAVRGLGIETGAGDVGSPAGPSRVSMPKRVSINSIPRVPVGAKSASPATPASDAALLGTPSLTSPPPGHARQFSAGSLSSPQLPSPGYEGAGGVAGAGVSPGGGGLLDSRFGKSQREHPSVSSLGSFRQPYQHIPDNERLAGAGGIPNTPGSIKSAYDGGFRPTEECPAHKNFYQGRANWLSICVMVLSVYSSVFSGIYLVIALKGPRYGRMIGSHGVLTYSTASLLTALFAKTIELSFVTVFVTFLGQVLSRRAFMKSQGKGITLAELTMRSWIMQPGTMLTHFESVRYAALSLLGVVSLFAAVVAMLYTTAADALVQPQLKFGGWEKKLLAGTVGASFANPTYLADNCRTPIADSDDAAKGTTCLQIQYAAQSYHNYQRYLSSWDEVASNGDGTTDLNTRPQGFALLNENTTVLPSWIDVQDVADTSTENRVVHNVSMAMPHPGVIRAARDEINGIMQPEDLEGIGIYSIHASVPSAVISVTCANMNETELEPIVFEAWNGTLDPAQWPAAAPQAPEEGYLNETVVDDIFGWGAKYGTNPPVFAKYPLEYNTILNHTAYPWGRPSIYLLGNAPETPEYPNQYFMCQMNASLTAYCSTRYNASQSGGSLEAICNDPPDDMAYIKSLHNASSGADTLSGDWLNIAFEWGNSLALNYGITDGNASNARLLTELAIRIPSWGGSPQLSPALPSPAEALAVLSGSTLLMSTNNAPFVPFWNYSKAALETPQYQYFNASIRAQEYASGGVYGYQLGFHLVLFLVFLTNVAVLGYFVVHKGLITDFSEPPNLFSLAVQSPPAEVLAGSCGAGPEGEQYKVNWFVSKEGEHLYMESGDPGVKWRKGRQSREVELMQSPISRSYEEFSKRRSIL